MKESAKFNDCFIRDNIDCFFYKFVLFIRLKKFFYTFHEEIILFFS